MHRCCEPNGHTGCPASLAGRTRGNLALRGAPFRTSCDLLTNSRNDSVLCCCCDVLLLRRLRRLCGRGSLLLYQVFGVARRAPQAILRQPGVHCGSHLNCYVCLRVCFLSCSVYMCVCVCVARFRLLALPSSHTFARLHLFAFAHSLFSRSLAFARLLTLSGSLSLLASSCSRALARTILLTLPLCAHSRSPTLSLSRFVSHCLVSLPFSCSFLSPVPVCVCVCVCNLVLSVYIYISSGCYRA